MSESLPDSALLDDSAVTSDEAPAPESSQAVVEESARGVDSVPAARFNGLMGKFNQTQTALEAARQRIAELEAATAATEESVTDVSGLQQQVAALQQMLMQEQLDKARAQAIQEFPGAATFADLIVADTPEAIKEMAKILHERVGQAAPAAPASSEAPAAEGTPDPAPEASAPAAPAPAPQVVGGTSITDAPVNAEERLSEAIKSRNFSEYLKAKAALTLSADSELVL